MQPAYHMLIMLSTNPHIAFYISGNSILELILLRSCFIDDEMDNNIKLTIEDFLNTWAFDTLFGLVFGSILI